MSPTGEVRALTPLWSLTIGAALGAGGALLPTNPAPAWLPVALVAGGLIFLCFGLGSRRWTIGLWLAAGLGVAGGHGLVQRSGDLALEQLIDRDAKTWIRSEMVVTEGWTQTRWGWRSPVVVRWARHPRLQVPPLRRPRLEIRGDVDPTRLPRPGDVVRGLVSIRGSPRSVLLTAGSVTLLEPTGSRGSAAAVRDRLATGLLNAAATDVTRIRAAELVAALSLGRRDLIPRERRDGWRRSGLAHVLAVSGLHVGLVAGMLYLILTAIGASPTVIRVIMILALPGYALLAGASPSATRAALMGCIYFGARLVGRAILPMAAVLLTASVLLFADPSLVASVSFQLTIVVTAALVRWAPSATAALPLLPRWMAAAVAIPVIAQLAAAPIVAFHFASVTPWAAVSNLCVPWLLAPVVAASVFATVLGLVAPGFAGFVLDAFAAGEALLWLAGTAGRAAELVPPPLSPWALVGMLIVGLAAIMPAPVARRCSAAYVAILLGSALWWRVMPPDRQTVVELLPVSHGLAAHLGTTSSHILVDGGGRRREAVQMLAEQRIRSLDAVIATHGDEDHIGGLRAVLRGCDVATLIVPDWLLRAPEAVPLLREARRGDTRVSPVVRGSSVSLGSGRLEVLWPPHRCSEPSDNERSLVARWRLPEGIVVLTADIGQGVELELVRSTRLKGSVLIVPHHGSRGSSSPRFLDAVDPVWALIPAGAENTHNHPHPEIVSRFENRSIEIRSPIHDGRCGVRLVDGGWRAYP